MFLQNKAILVDWINKNFFSDGFFLQIVSLEWLSEYIFSKIEYFNMQFNKYLEVDFSLSVTTYVTNDLRNRS